MVFNENLKSGNLMRLMPPVSPNEFECSNQELILTFIYKGSAVLFWAVEAANKNLFFPLSNCNALYSGISKGNIRRLI